MASDLTIALAQINPVVGDVEGNAQAIRETRARAAQDHADLVVLSELVLAGYPPEDLVLKPAFQQEVEAAAKTLAKETADGGPAVLLGAPWLHDGHLYNAALLLDGGKIEAVRCTTQAFPYCSTHPLDVGPPPRCVPLRRAGQNGLRERARLYVVELQVTPEQSRADRVGKQRFEQVLDEQRVDRCAATVGAILAVPILEHRARLTCFRAQLLRISCQQQQGFDHSGRNARHELALQARGTPELDRTRFGQDFEVAFDSLRTLSRTPEPFDATAAVAARNGVVRHDQPRPSRVRRRHLGRVLLRSPNRQRLE